jgi:general secretion pathway protein A
MAKDFADHFGFTNIPFGKDLDHKDLFRYPQIDELYKILDLTLKSMTATLVTGQAGTGKTTAIRGFLDILPTNRYKIVYLGYDQKGSTMFARMAQEFGTSLMISKGHRMLRLSQYIERNIVGSGKQLVLVIDEAHLLEGSTLEDIRLLTSSEMDRKSHVTLVLLGQLWLRSKLKSHGHEALYQRMRFRYGLEGLTQQQTKDYVKHHLRLVGCNRELFSEGALGLIFFHSGGILREINNLCVESLFKAFSQNKEKVDEKHVKLVVDQRETA